MTIHNESGRCIGVAPIMPPQILLEAAALRTARVTANIIDNFMMTKRDDIECSSRLTWNMIPRGQRPVSMSALPTLAHCTALAGSQHPRPTTASKHRLQHA